MIGGLPRSRFGLKNMNTIRNPKCVRLWCWLVLLAMVGAAGVGCQPEGGRKLSGKWRLDAKQSLAGRMGQGGANSNDAAGIDAPKTGGADGEFQTDSEVTLTFRSNGELETVTHTGTIDSTKSGTWRLVSFDAEKTTAVVACTLNGQVTEHAIEWLDKDSIKMTPPNMAGLTMKLIFRRAN